MGWVRSSVVFFLNSAGLSPVVWTDAGFQGRATSSKYFGVAADRRRPSGAPLRMLDCLIMDYTRRVVACPPPLYGGVHRVENKRLLCA